MRWRQTSPFILIQKTSSNILLKHLKNYEKLGVKNFRQVNQYEKWLNSLTVNGKVEITILKMNTSSRHFVIVEKPKKI